MLHLVLKRAYEPFVGHTYVKAIFVQKAWTNFLLRNCMPAVLIETLPAQSRFMLENAGPFHLRSYLQHQPDQLDLLQIEHESEASIEVDGRLFRLKGTLDRLDRREHGLVILDYKSGVNLRQTHRDFWKDRTLWDAMATWSPDTQDPLPMITDSLQAFNFLVIFICAVTTSVMKPSSSSIL
jgi:hypothetical protein